MTTINRISLALTETQAVVLYVIYQRPTDYPECFVVRRWAVTKKHGVIVEHGPYYVAMTLTEARGSLPVGLVNLGRHPADDPKITEVWA